MLQEKSFLKSFDRTELHKKNFEEEIAKINNEQQKIYEQKLVEAEKRINDEVHKKLSQKFETDLKNERDKLAQKFAQDIKQLSENFKDTHEKYIENFTKIIQFFINHHIVILNKAIMRQEIVDKIRHAFKHTHQQNFQVYLNNYTLKDIQSTLEQIPHQIHIHTDDSLEDGTIQVTFDGGGIYFSVFEIMNTLSEICSEVAGIDFSEF